MSCPCGAERPEDCDALAELAGPELGGVDWDQLHRAMWCLLHPLQCRRDPKTGRPILAAVDLLVLGGLIYLWHVTTKD